MNEARTLVPQPARVAAHPLTLNKILVSVAMALEARGEQVLIGMQGIEERETREILDSQTKFDPIALVTAYFDRDRFNDMNIEGTIFGAIADELALLGFKEPTTVGEVATILGIDLSDEEGARYQIHLLGCWCEGVTIPATVAAKRIRNLMT